MNEDLLWHYHQYQLFFHHDTQSVCGKFGFYQNFSYYRKFPHYHFSSRAIVKNSEFKAHFANSTPAGENSSRGTRNSSIQGHQINLSTDIPCSTLIRSTVPLFNVKCRRDIWLLFILVSVVYKHTNSVQFTAIIVNCIMVYHMCNL